jgi:drug/metabolite transporter (DMT)-like permease
MLSANLVPQSRTKTLFLNALPQLKLIGVAAFWGGTFISGRVLAQAMPHLTISALRFVIAFAILMVVAWRIEGGLPKLNRSQFLATLGLGLTGVFAYNIFFLAALERIPAGKTALIVSLSPILTALIVAFILHEKLGPKRWLGIIMALVGVSIVVTQGQLLNGWQAISQTFELGEGFMLLAVCSWVAYTITSRFALKGLSAIAATTYATLFGALFLSVGALFEIPQLTQSMFSLTNIGAILYLGVFGTAVAFIWYSEGVKTIGAARTVVFTNLVPVFGLIFGALILSEPILPSMLLGGAIVITGVFLTNHTRKVVIQ